MSELRTRGTVNSQDQIIDEAIERNRVCYTFKDRRAIKEARLISRGFGEFISWAGREGVQELDEDAYVAFREWVEQENNKPARHYTGFRDGLRTNVGQDTLKVYVTSDHFGNSSGKEFYTHHGFARDEPLLQLATLDAVMDSEDPTSMTEKCRDEGRFVSEEDYASYSRTAGASEHGYLSDELVRSLRLHRFLERSNKGAGIVLEQNRIQLSTIERLTREQARLLVEQEMYHNMLGDFYRIDEKLGLVVTGDDTRLIRGSLADDVELVGDRPAVSPYRLDDIARERAQDFDVKRVVAFRISREFDKFKDRSLLTEEGRLRLWDMTEPVMSMYEQFAALGVEYPRPADYGYKQ